jgi:predicted flavoprotein YhiN
VQSVDGPVLLTHFGISGPNVFALSALLAFEKIALDAPMDIVLYPEADTSYDMWIGRLHEAAAHSPKKELRTVVKQWFPERLAVAILAVCAMDPATWMGILSKEKKKDIAHFLAG